MYLTLHFCDVFFCNRKFKKLVGWIVINLWRSLSVRVFISTLLVVLLHMPFTLSNFISVTFHIILKSHLFHECVCRDFLRFKSHASFVDLLVFSAHFHRYLYHSLLYFPLPLDPHFNGLQLLSLLLVLFSHFIGYTHLLLLIRVCRYGGFSHWRNKHSTYGNAAII